MDSDELAYAEGFFPADDDIIVNRGIWSQWFDDKKTVKDSKWVSIDDWVNNDEQDDNLSCNTSDSDFVVVPDLNSSPDTVNVKQLSFSNNNEKCMEIQRYDNLKLKPSEKNELTETIKLIDFYFSDIVNKRLEKWKNTNMENLSSPYKQNENFTKENANNWFSKFDNFKGKVKIKEVRTISYTRDSDTESTDSYRAENSRRGRNKVKTSVSDKNRSRVTKQYSYVKEITANKLCEVKRNTTSNGEYFQSDKSGASLRSHNNKTIRRRSKKHEKLGKSLSRSTSSSSSEKTNYDQRNAKSRSLALLNQTHISSDVTDLSDPDDKILHNVRKAYKDLGNPTIINSSKSAAICGTTLPQELCPVPNTTCVLHSTSPTEPIIEFPSEPEEQLVVYNNNQCVPKNESIVSDTEDDDSEDDIIFMSNKKRLRLYGKCYVEQSVGTKSLVLYNPRLNDPNEFTNDSSTDDGIFKRKNYKPIEM